MSITAGEDILIVYETLTVDGTTSSTDTSTGALTVAGGVGIGENANVGGDVVVEGTTHIQQELTIGTGTTSYVFPATRGTTGQILTFSTTSGELEFSNLNVVNVPGNFGTDDRLIKSSGTGTDVEMTGITLTDGGDMSGINSIDVVNDATIGGELKVTSTASSTNTTTGTIIVAGGVGIAENLNIGGDLMVETDTNLVGTLTLGDAGTDYAFPTEAGLPGQILTMSTDGSLIFSTSSASPFSVNAPVPFGTDNRLVRTLGTDRDIEATDIIVSDTSDITGINTLDVNGATTIGGVLTLSSTVGSSNTATGALVVAGGVGVAENLNVGGDTNVTGIVNVNNTTESTSSTNGALVVDGGVGIVGNLNVGGTIYADGIALGDGDFQIESTTVSNDTTSGALVVAGGVGIGGDVNIGGDTNVGGTLTASGVTSVTDTTSSINNTTGALLVAGGVGIVENLNMGGILNVNNATGSTNSGDGALVVDGGAGIAENLNVGGDLNAEGQVNVNNTTNSTGTGTGALVVDGGVSITKDLYVGGSIILDAPLVSNSQFFNAYNTTPVVVSTTTFSALPWDTEIRKDADLYTHTAASTDVDVAEDGWYKIVANVATEITVGNGNNRTISSARVTINGVPVTGSTSYMYNRTAQRGHGTCTINIMQNLTANDTINIEINRLVGTSTVTSIASACRIFVARV
jgi:hypothetical protein